MSEFNLSENMWESEDFGFWIHSSKVKEFIKRLKEEIKRGVTRNKVFPMDWCFDSIDKLAGDKLK